MGGRGLKKELDVSLKQATISGAKWSAVAQAATQIVQFTALAVLARLLAPSDIGLMSMATAFTAFAMLFHDLGTSIAVVQRREISESLLSSVFWVNVGFGISVMLVLSAISPLIAAFYQEPRLVPILVVLSLNFSLSGLSILQYALLRRQMAFQRMAHIDMSSTMAGALMAIVAAAMGAGVWSLVYQVLVLTTAKTSMLWLTTRWRPAWIFDWQEVKSITGFSVNLTGFNMLNYFARNADYLLIGRYLGPQPLGYYTLAYRIMLYPIQHISHVIGKVVLPAYSQLQDDNRQLGQAYLKTAGFIAVLSFPMMMGVLGVAEPLVLTLLGEQWSPVIMLLIILAPVGMLQSIMATVGIVYQAKGRTDLLFLIGGGNTTLILVAFAIGLQWGIIGVATAYAVVLVIVTYPNFAVPLRLIDLSVLDLWGVLWRPFTSSLVMLAIVVWLRVLLPPDLVSGLELVMTVSVGVLVYGLASWMINQAYVREGLQLVGMKL
jgi:PST family polysaccharide transporter